MDQSSATASAASAAMLPQGETVPHAPTITNGFATVAHQHHHGHGNNLIRVKSLDNCRVCGDGPARMHYGVPTCFGCKGFFRRTLKRTKEYSCRYSGNCVVDRYERNSCRYCRFKRCLEVGMDPKAVRPDRDAAGRTHPRRRLPRNALLGANGEIALGDQEMADAGSSGTDEWVRKLPVEMRTLLIQIMNIDAMVAHGDVHDKGPKDIYPLPFTSIRQMLEDPSCLDGRRSEIRYEPYRQVEPDELTALAHRRLVAAVDMIDHLCALMDLHNIRDRIVLIKAAFAPLTLFCAVSSTARVTRNRDILCLCNFGFVPRGAHLSYAEPYHFANRLVDRALDELVEPFRTFNFKEQEIVLMKAIVSLNPYLPNLSTEAAEQVADFRDRIQETLYNVVRESHPKEVASSRFGNLLLFLPNIMLISSIMIENLQFIQSFRHQQIGPLLSELLEEDTEGEAESGVVEDGGGHHAESSEESMRHSQSTSSICSMTSAVTTSGELYWQHTAQQVARPRQYSVGHLNDIRTTQLNSSSSAHQLVGLGGATLSQNDSDPDYNITLTAETLKQAIHHHMEVDSPESCQKPQFFIDPSVPLNQPPPISDGISISGQQQREVTTTTVASSKHVFTVEKTAAVPQGGGRSVPDFSSQQQFPVTFTPIFPNNSDNTSMGQKQFGMKYAPIEEENNESGVGMFFMGGMALQQQRSDLVARNVVPQTASGGLVINKSQSYPSTTKAESMRAAAAAVQKYNDHQQFQQ